MVIDCHYHLEERLLTIEELLQKMDEAGVDASVVHLAQWNAKGLTVCSELNNGFADLAQSHPDRLFPCAHLPLSGDEGTLVELNRAVSDLNFRAVALLSSEGDVHLGSESLRPLFARIAELDQHIEQRLVASPR